METRKIYFVDTENVGSTWKDLLPAKRENDKLLLFFTENSPYISYTDLQIILQYPDQFELIRCNPGKNGLDFQLVSYLGYLMCSAPDSEYIIVSNDNGFDAVVKFWQERNASIVRGNVFHLLNPDAPAATENVPRCRSERYGRYGRHRRASVPAADYRYNAVDSIIAPIAKPDAEVVAEEAAPPAFRETEAVEVVAEEADLPAFRETEAVEVAEPELISTQTTFTDNTDVISLDTKPLLSVEEIVNQATTAMENSFSVEVKGNSPVEWDPNLAYIPEASAASGSSDESPETSEASPSSETDAKSPKAGNGASKTTRKRKAKVTAKAAEEKPQTSEPANEANDTSEAEKPSKSKKAASKKPAAKRTKKDTAKASSESQEEASELPSATEDVNDAATAAAAVETTTAETTTKKTKATSKKTTSPKTARKIAAEKEKPEKEKLSETKKAELIRKHLPEIFERDSQSVQIIADIIFGNDTKQHHELHLAFVKNFGDEQGTVLYKAYRPHLSEYRKLMK